MQCLLLNSPIYSSSTDLQEDYLPPLGLGYITTHLREAGVEAELVDCVKEKLGINEIFKLLKQKRPDYLGLNIFTQNYEIVRRIVEECPIKTVIVIGGQATRSIYPELLEWNIKNELIIQIGEGERLWPTLVCHKCDEPPIIEASHKRVYKIGKDSRYYPTDLGESHLDRTLFSGYTIRNHYGDNEAAIVTSRGCIYDCAFCGGAHSLNADVDVRYRELEDIAREIHQILQSDPTIKSIRVLDDLFLRSAESIRNAVQLFSCFEGLSWRAMAHVLTFSSDRAKQEVPMLKTAGCTELFIGIESGSELMRKQINKLGSVQQIIDAVSVILDAGINIKGYFMYGFPGETIEMASETLKLAQRIHDISNRASGKFRTSVFQFRPYHGTRLYQEILDSGRPIPSIQRNQKLSELEGRTQFNFQSGNYSDMDDDTLIDFIRKTQFISEVN